MQAASLLAKGKISAPVRRLRTVGIFAADILIGRLRLAAEHREARGPSQTNAIIELRPSAPFFIGQSSQLSYCSAKIRLGKNSFLIWNAPFH